MSFEVEAPWEDFPSDGEVDTSSASETEAEQMASDDSPAPEMSQSTQYNNSHDG